MAVSLEYPAGTQLPAANLLRERTVQRDWFGPSHAAYSSGQLSLQVTSTAPTCWWTTTERWRGMVDQVPGVFRGSSTPGGAALRSIITPLAQVVAGHDYC